MFIVERKGLQVIYLGDEFGDGLFISNLKSKMHSCLKRRKIYLLNYTQVTQVLDTVGKNWALGI